MSRDRRALLQLIAWGRVTPAEAERLLMLWNTDRETLWVVGACLILAVMGETHMHGIPGAVHAVRSLLPATIDAIRQAASRIKL
jgi:hypothetical protein